MCRLFFLTMLGLQAMPAMAGGGVSSGKCKLTMGEESVFGTEDAVDAALDIYASIQRCGTANDKLKCTVDVLESVLAVNSLASDILTAVNDCELLPTEAETCGLQLTKMTGYTEGIATEVGKVLEKCSGAYNATALNASAPSPAPEPMNVTAKPNRTSGLGCAQDAAGVVMQLFNTVNTLKGIKAKCGGQDSGVQCAQNALSIGSAISAISGFMSGGLKDCEKAVLGKAASVFSNNIPLCAEAISGISEYAMEVGEASLDLQRKCGGDDAIKVNEHAATERAGAVEGNIPTSISGTDDRLYSADDADHSEASNPNLILAAMLPVTAFVGFIGGSIQARRRIAAGGHRVLNSVVDIDSADIE